MGADLNLPFGILDLIFVIAGKSPDVKSHMENAFP
jgi:hypothetical protein